MAHVALFGALLDVLLQTFADLRVASGAAGSDDERLESALSTAEQIGVVEDAVLHGQFFSDAELRPAFLARSLVGTLVRRMPEDLNVMNKFWHAVVAPRADAEGDPWREFCDGGKEAMALHD